MLKLRLTGTLWPDNVIYVKAWCARDNPLDRLYQVRETELMGFGGVASFPKVKFQYLKIVAVYYG